MMHGSGWTLKYDEPEVENVARQHMTHSRSRNMEIDRPSVEDAPSCDMFNVGSSYFHVALTTVRHLLNVARTTVHHLYNV